MKVQLGTINEIASALEESGGRGATAQHRECKQPNDGRELFEIIIATRPAALLLRCAACGELTHVIPASFDDKDHAIAKLKENFHGRVEIEQ